jgi:hypothetical protein
LGGDNNKVVKSVGQGVVWEVDERERKRGPRSGWSGEFILACLPLLTYNHPPNQPTNPEVLVGALPVSPASHLLLA